MEREEKEEQRKQQSLLQAGLAGAQADTVQRYGAAVKEHAVAYTGVDRETGQKLAKGLKEISKSKVNPDYRDQNIRQQAGFSAEVKTQARENAEKAIQNKTAQRTVRTDDMSKQSDGRGHTIGGKNEQFYDLAEVGRDGTYIEGSGRQLKYVGSDAKDCCQKLLGRKFDKYRDADVPIEVPSDFFEDVKKRLEERADALKRQIDRAEQRGDAALAQKHRDQLERVEKTKNSLRRGKLTNAEALEARKHPVLSTVKDAAGVAHRAGVESAKYGATIGGTVSIVQNLTAVARGDQGTRRGGPGRREGHGILRGYQLWNGLCRFRCEGIDAERQVRNRANIVQDQPSGDSGYRVAERRLYHEAVLQRRDLWRGVL